MNETATADTATPTPRTSPPVDDLGLETNSSSWGKLSCSTCYGRGEIKRITKDAKGGKLEPCECAKRRYNAARAVILDKQRAGRAGSIAVAASAPSAVAAVEASEPAGPPAHVLAEIARLEESLAALASVQAGAIEEVALSVREARDEQANVARAVAKVEQTIVDARAVAGEQRMRASNLRAEAARVETVANNFERDATCLELVDLPWARAELRVADAGVELADRARRAEEERCARRRRPLEKRLERLQAKVRRRAARPS